jgi:hypothetical protein
MEKYILGQSKLGRVIAPCDEVRLDIHLKANPFYEGTLIYGFIENINTGKPVCNVCVICYSPCGSVLGQGYSNEKGLYFIPNIVHNQRLYLRAMKPGHSTYYSGFYCTGNNPQCCINGYLSQIRRPTCTICGHVYNAAYDDIENAMVYLTKEVSTHCGINTKVVCSTITNAYGQFVCDQVPDGKYYVNVEHRCYELYVGAVRIQPNDDLISYRVVMVDRYCGEGSLNKRQ